MQRALTIAIFRTEETIEDQLLELMSRFDMRSLLTANLQELLDLTHDLPDCILVPSRISSGANPAGICLECKASPELRCIPVIAINYSKDGSIIQAMIAAGADLVLNNPLDPEILFYTIHAQVRQKKLFEEHYQNPNSGSSNQFDLLQAVREGLLVINHNSGPVFINHSGALILGYPPPVEPQSLQNIGEQFTPLLEAVRKGNYPVGSLVTFEHPLLRQNGQNFAALVKILELIEGQDNGLWIIAFSDLSEIDLLSSNLVQARRLQALSLMTCSAAGLLLQQKFKTLPLASAFKLEEMLVATENSCDLESTLTFLLELIDLVLGSKVSIKVSIQGKFNLAVNQSDLIQLIGHLIFQAVEVTGNLGEVNIIAQQEVSGDYTAASAPREVLLLISGNSRRIPAYYPDDSLSRLVRGDYSRTFLEEKDGSKRHQTTLLVNNKNIEVEQSTPGKLAFGLACAQTIADKYKKIVEYQQSSQNSIKLRIRLPLK